MSSRQMAELRGRHAQKIHALFREFLEESITMGVILFAKFSETCLIALLYAKWLVWFNRQCDEDVNW
jgi:hypothetical protein